MAAMSRMRQARQESPARTLPSNDGSLKARRIVMGLAALRLMPAQPARGWRDIREAKASRRAPGA
jgi:hypothetical protein